jgi:20S proteasome alpha/beta subunit
MTLIVGIQCSDGVVMASDSAASFAAGVQFTIGQQEMTKVRTLAGVMLYGSSGAVGMQQLICDRIEKYWKANATIFANASTAEAMQKVGAEITKVVTDYIQVGQMLRPEGGLQTALCKSLFAIPLSGSASLIQFDYSGAPEAATKELPFVALGSGQPIADPFLAFLKRLLWKEREPTVAEGRFAAAWTIQHAIQTNPGGVAGPLQMATLTFASSRPKIDVIADIAEHEQAVTEAERVLATHIHNSLGSGNAVSSEEVPRPDS